MLYLFSIFIARLRGSMSMKYETVIFDLDGTLLNTLGDLTDSVNHILEKFGYPLRTEGEIRKFLGNGSRDLIARSLPVPMDGEEFERIHDEYLAWYTSHSQIRTAPYEGIPELLKKLNEAGIKTAIVSNKGDRQVQALAAKHFPDVKVVMGERPGIRRKPHPDAILAAMALLSADPATTALVGDSEVDVQTARNAGIGAVAVGWGFRDKEELMRESPDVFINAPGELLSH